MSTAIALFTRDLRVHDNPVLAAAARSAEHVVPLFVVDEGITEAGFVAPPRQTFLAESLADLDSRLRDRGARLVLRYGPVVEEVRRLADEVDAHEVHMASDVSGYAQHRQRHLDEALAVHRRRLHCHDEVTTVLAPGAVQPAGNDHFAVFTPYHRRWAEAGRRAVTDPPRSLRLPPKVKAGRHPARGVRLGSSWKGGETEARQRLRHWVDADAAGYADQHDALAADATSRLSPYLHFGCLSPVEVVHRAAEAGAESFVRQLAWRDFHHQVLAARPASATRDYRFRGDRWRHDDDAWEAWTEGRTGIPVVDAGMRQLRAEHWMHNRARLITASFLTKTLYLDWRSGARHFLDFLVDGDLANNNLNWQWVAGTGTDTRPNRVLNPLRQAERYDPDGAYVRRWVPELADLRPPEVHQPWRLGERELRRRGYPQPLVDLDEGRRRFLRARSA